MVDRAGPRERQGWGPKQEQVGCRVPGESDEFLEVVLWLRESGLSGVSVKPLLHMGPRGLALASPSRRGFPWSSASPLIGTIWRTEPGSPIWGSAQWWGEGRNHLRPDAGVRDVVLWVWSIWADSGSLLKSGRFGRAGLCSGTRQALQLGIHVSLPKLKGRWTWGSVGRFQICPGFVSLEFLALLGSWLGDALGEGF